MTAVIRFLNLNKLKQLKRFITIYSGKSFFPNLRLTAYFARRNESAEVMGSVPVIY